MNTLRIFSWIILLSILAVAQGCNDEESLNLDLTEVKTLYTPEDQYSVVLKPARDLSETFQWDKAYAKDGSLVLYEVAFDYENGDFSQPFYRAVSDDKGLQNKLTLSHAELNEIAKLGGSAFFEKKKFKWTVMASKGSNVKKAAMSRTIEIERPGGFDVLPGNLYLTGSATEGGTDVANAKQFEKLGVGKFEIQSKLKSGTYKFVDGLTGTARTFFIGDDEGSKVVGVDGENIYDDSEKIYRITADFNSLAIQVVEVKSVSFWYAPNDEFWGDLSYKADGVWSLDNVTVNLRAESWGLDERHKYKMVINDGTGDKEEWWGYEQNDSPSQDGKYGVDQPAYYKAYKIASNDRWNYSWKMDRPAIQGKKADFVLSFNGATPYHMEYIIH